MTTLYSLRSTPKEGEFVVMKFDSDYEVESVYALSATLCVCPAGHKPKCRHRSMLPLFLAHSHVDDGWFLDWDTRLWRKPLSSSPDLLVEGDLTLADQLVLPSIATEGQSIHSIVCKRTGQGIGIGLTGGTCACKSIDNCPIQDPEPMMDTIRKMAEADEIAAEDTTQAPPQQAPAPPLSRVEGAGATPLKRRKITL